MDDKNTLILTGALAVGGLMLAKYISDQAAAAGQNVSTYIRTGIQQAGSTPLDPYTPDSILCQWFPSWCGIKTDGSGTNTGTASGTTTGTADTGNVCYRKGFVGPIPQGAHECGWGDWLYPFSTTVIG